MTHPTLQEAFAKTTELPEADQERIARELIDYVDHLRALRVDIAAGVRSLDAGLGRELDIENVIARARAENAEA